MICVYGFRWLARRRGFELCQGIIHASFEVALVVVLPSAVVRPHLHLTACTFRNQLDVVGSLQDRSRNIDMRGVLYIIGSSHLGVVTRLDAVVLRVAQCVFDGAPQFATSNGIICFVGHADRGQGKRNSN